MRPFLAQFWLHRKPVVGMTYGYLYQPSLAPYLHIQSHVPRWPDGLAGDTINRLTPSRIHPPLGALNLVNTHNDACIRNALRRLCDIHTRANHSTATGCCLMDENGAKRSIYFYLLGHFQLRACSHSISPSFLYTTAEDTCCKTTYPGLHFHLPAF